MAETQPDPDGKGRPDNVALRVRCGLGGRPRGWPYAGQEQLLGLGHRQDRGERGSWPRPSQREGLLAGTFVTA